MMRVTWLLSGLLLVAVAEAGRLRDRHEKNRDGRRYSVQAPSLPEVRIKTPRNIERAFAPLTTWFQQLGQTSLDSDGPGLPTINRPNRELTWTWDWFGKPQTRLIPEPRPRRPDGSGPRTSQWSWSPTLGRPAVDNGHRGRDRGTMMSVSGRDQYRPRDNAPQIWNVHHNRNPSWMRHNPASYRPSLTSQWRDGFGNQRDTRGHGAASSLGNGQAGSWSWSYSAPTVPRPDFDAIRNRLFQHRFNWYHQYRPTHPTGRQRPNTRPNIDRQSPKSNPVDGSTYETLCRGRHYSARRYNTSVWVSAMVVNGSSVDALRRIKGYFMGENDQGVIIEMSRPLRMTVSSMNGTISDTENTIEDFLLSARLPAEFERNPPTPTDDRLNISIEPSTIFFATDFRPARRPGTPAIYDEFFELQDALDSAREAFQRGTFHAAFYETWTDVVLGSLPSRPRPGEILIAGASPETSLMCGVEMTERGWQNGIEQCGQSRCPEYERLGLLRKDIELRRIRGGTFITRTAPACSMILPAFVSHCALKRYLSGSNADSMTYPSPAPFIHYMYPSPLATSFCKQTATSGYMLPPGMAAAEPMQGDLRIKRLPSREAYVMKFKGRPTPRTVEEKVDELRTFLRCVGRCFVPDRYVIAVYDHPFSRPPHLNEVMVFRRQGGCRGSDMDVEVVTESPTSSATPTPTSTTTVPTTTERMTTTSDAWMIDATTTAGTTSGELTSSFDLATSRDGATSSDGLTSTTESTTGYPSLVEVQLSLETNSILDADLIPYRFSGNQTDFPEDFPTDVFVF